MTPADEAGMVISIFTVAVIDAFEMETKPCRFTDVRLDAAFEIENGPWIFMVEGSVGPRRTHRADAATSGVELALRLRSFEE